MKKALLLACITLFSLSLHAQQKYWIYFKDKTPEVPTLSKTELYDLPINQAYLDSLSQLGITARTNSKWLNAITAYLSQNEYESISTLGFVKALSPVEIHFREHSSTGSLQAVQVLNQLNADTLIALGWFGKGIKIGIIDGGFLGADEADELSHILSNKQVAAYKNYIEKDVTNPYTGSARYQDNHGTKVWTMIAGRSGSEKYFGTATEAMFYLARTDQGDKEYRGEEDHWVAAVEWMYEQGVKLINSSVGYSTGFNDASQNYSPSDVDGSSSAITKAANIATKEKGMTIVLAAGNDGNNKFKVVSVPADAEGVITVGATDIRNWKRQYYSSIGPENLKHVKPDLSCYSVSGTSFAAPVITGLIASLQQGFPEATPQEIRKALEQSAHLSQLPNNYLGYGVPNIKKAIDILHGEKNKSQRKIIKTEADEVEVMMGSDNLVAFYKSDAINVLFQKLLISRNGKVTVKRQKEAERTTVASPEKCVEIIWE